MRLTTTLAEKIRFNRTRHRHLVRGASSYLTAVAVQALGGFVFWVLAAQITGAEAVGLAAALFSSMTFVTYLTNFGIVIAVARHAGSTSVDHQIRFALACGLTFASSLVGALVYVVLLRNRFDTSGPPVAVGLAFLVTTSLFSVAQLVDTRMMSLRRLRLLIGRNAGVAVVKSVLLLLLLPRTHNALWLFVLATAPDVVSSLVGAGWLTKAVPSALRRGERATELRSVIRYARFAYFSQLAINAPIMGLPFIVLLSVAPTTNASFFVAWGFVGVVFLVPQSATMALHVEGTAESQDLASQLRLALRGAVGVTSLCFVGSFVVARLVPLIYGDDFVLAGDLLPWLVLGCIPWCVVLLLLAEARVLSHYGASLAISAAALVFCLVPALVLTPLMGLTGTVTAWVVGMTAAAVGASLIRRHPRFAAVTPPPLVDADTGPQPEPADPAP